MCLEKKTWTKQQIYQMICPSDAHAELCPIRMPFAHTRIPIHDLIWKEGSQFVNVNWMGLFSPTLWIPIQLNELAFTMLHIQRSIRMSIQNWIEWSVRVLIPLWIGHIQPWGQSEVKYASTKFHAQNFAGKIAAAKRCCPQSPFSFPQSASADSR